MRSCTFALLLFASVLLPSAEVRAGHHHGSGHYRPSFGLSLPGIGLYIDNGGVSIGYPARRYYRPPTYCQPPTYYQPPTRYQPPTYYQPPTRYQPPTCNQPGVTDFDAYRDYLDQLEDQFDHQIKELKERARQQKIEQDRHRAIYR